MKTCTSDAGPRSNLYTGNPSVVMFHNGRPRGLAGRTPGLKRGTTHILHGWQYDASDPDSPDRSVEISYKIDEDNRCRRGFSFGREAAPTEVP